MHENKVKETKTRNWTIRLREKGYFKYESKIHSLNIHSIHVILS